LNLNDKDEAVQCLSTTPHRHRGSMELQFYTF